MHILFGQFDLHTTGRLLLSGGVPVALSPRAFDLLVILAERAGTLVTKAELLELAWPNVIVEENALQVQISALRKALGRGAISTVSGHGYRFDPAVEKISAEPSSGPRIAAHNLPHSVNTFVGREAEIAQILHRLGEVRLLCLVGAGGCGKTRLALQAARKVLTDYEGGVWLVEFAALSDPSLVPNALASVLELKEQPGKTLTETLVAHLSSRRSLILLDNAEHLLDAIGALVDTLLRRCGEVSLLVTSRERLNVSGEATFRVPSLSMPDPEHDITGERLERFESARLLVDRIKLLRPHFMVDDENAAAIASICHRLDGMPLALELAAPRFRAMSVDEVSRRLERRFALLTDGPRTAMNRQRTLRAAVDWSYDLLSDAERALLRRLSVFAGGWSPAAAEAVCSDATLSADLLLELLTSLVDKSLVLLEEESGQQRFRMLQTVREYASDRLHEEDDAVQWQIRHLDFFLSVGESAHEALSTANPAVMRMLEADHDNLRLALTASRYPGCTVKALRLASALYRFWWWSGRWSEGFAALGNLLEREGGSAEPSLRASALSSAGIFAGLRGEHEAARSLHEQSLAISRGSGDLRRVAVTLVGLGINDFDQGLHDSARRRQEEALAIARKLEDAELLGKVLNNLGNIATEVGDLATARMYHGECLALHRASNDRWGTASSLNNLALVARYEGDLPSARKRCEEALAIIRETGEPRSIAMVVAHLGAIALGLGDQSAGARMLAESLSTFSKLGDRLAASDVVEVVANSLATRIPTAAICLWGAVEQLREQLKVRESPVDRARKEKCLVQARAELADVDVFDREWRKGRSMMWPQVEQIATGLLTFEPNPGGFPKVERSHDGARRASR